VGASHGLQIVLRVPVRVEDNDSVGGFEVDAETTSTGREKEDEVRRVGRVEMLDRLAAGF
jgi:hypothetical protein